MLYHQMASHPGTNNSYLFVQRRLHTERILFYEELRGRYRAGSRGISHLIGNPCEDQVDFDPEGLGMQASVEYLHQTIFGHTDVPGLVDAVSGRHVLQLSEGVVDWSCPDLTTAVVSFVATGTPFYVNQS